MKKIFKSLSLIAIVLVGVLGGLSVEASQFNYSVTPQLPKNQISKENSYFDLLLKRNEVQELFVNLRNDTDKDIDINVDINSATTNTNGVVEYSNNTTEKDSSLKHDLKELVTFETEVKIQAKSNQIFKIQVKMPSEKIEGLIAGGITFSEKKTNDVIEKEKDKGLSINNEYAYVVALVIRQSEKVEEANLLLNKAEAGQLNARNVILSQLQNPVGSYLNQLTTKTTIMKKGSSDVLYSTIKEGMQMAPNTNFQLPLSLDGEKLKPGKYTVEIKAFSGLDEEGSYSFGKDQDGKEKKYKYKWELETDFEISAEIAKSFNKKDVTIKNVNSINYYLLIGALLLLILGVVFIFLSRKKKKKALEKRKTQATPKKRKSAKKKSRIN